MCSVAPPEQSGFIGRDGTVSPRYADQLELYVDFECTTDHLSAEDVDANVESITLLVPPAPEPTPTPPPTPTPSLTDVQPPAPT
ncbi:hypothetical protein [Georgenia sp. H159]|uniref:hypothetical protein n=1 Tax=Georgenia sp. H159 TaxID=3076115 RepID=UPI002D7998E3|nr:hypothetical protein [Georgenia sp. H159]